MTIPRNLSILAEGASSTGVLAATNGGTGIASYTIGDLLYASGTTTLSKLADVATGSVLISGGVGVAPSWSATPTVTSLTSPTIKSASSLTLQTNGTTTALTIDTSQNVGIGTSSPATTLDVNGAIRINNAASFQWYGSSASTNQKFWDAYSDNSTGNTLYFRTINDAYSAANSWLAVGRVGYTVDYVAFYTASSSERMRIDSSGNVGIGTTANASAILDAQSTTKGVRFPNMTTTQKNAISSPAAGLVVFDTTLAKLCVYSGSAWQTITSV